MGSQLSEVHRGGAHRSGAPYQRMQTWKGRAGSPLHAPLTSITTESLCDRAGICR